MEWYQLLCQVFFPAASGVAYYAVAALVLHALLKRHRILNPEELYRFRQMVAGRSHPHLAMEAAWVLDECRQWRLKSGWARFKRTHLAAPAIYNSFPVRIGCRILMQWIAGVVAFVRQVGPVRWLMQIGRRTPFQEVVAWILRGGGKLSGFLLGDVRNAAPEPKPYSDQYLDRLLSRSVGYSIRPIGAVVSCFPNGYVSRSGPGAGDICFAADEVLTKMPIVLGSALDHELTHLVTEVMEEAVSREYAGKIGWIEKAWYEVHAFMTGSPLILVSYLTILLTPVGVMLAFK